MRMTQVLQTQDISPHMRRIILTGEQLQDFPVQHESAHVKVIIPRPGQLKPRLGMYFGAKKWMRSYTVRAFNPESLTLTLDFAVNDHEGLASNWAAQAKPGDYLGIAGPGAIKHTDMFADWHLIVGDLTALPAIAATIERLPVDAKGYVFIQVPSEEDIQGFPTPQNLHLKWVVQPAYSETLLLEHVKSIKPLEGTPAIFIANEGKIMKLIKQHVKNSSYYSKTLTYASAYWNREQRGL